jgi:uncharacterized BrkB/YihY/UPF0761 family membrane protein
MNRAYDVPESRAFWKTGLLAVGITLLAGTAIIVAFSLMIAVQVWGHDIADKVGAGSAFEQLLSWGRWPVIAIVLLFAMAFVYWAIPNIELPFRWVSPGALTFTVVWTLASFFFALYVANVASYNATYGTLGGVVVLLLWFYLTSIVMLLGAEINAVIEKVKDPAHLQERQAAKRTEAEERIGRHGQPVIRPAGTEPPPHVPASAGRSIQAGPVTSALGAAVTAATVWRLARRVAR